MAFRPFAVVCVSAALGKVCCPAVAPVIAARRSLVVDEIGRLAATGWSSASGYGPEQTAYAVTSSVLKMAVTVQLSGLLPFAAGVPVLSLGNELKKGSPGVLSNPPPPRRAPLSQVAVAAPAPVVSTRTT